MVIAGKFCRPPTFYDLEEVFQSCDADNKPTATTTDRCSNFHDTGFDGKKESCADYIAVCRHCGDATSAGNDSVGKKAQALTIPPDERDSTIAGIFNLLDIINCGVTETDLLSNIIIQRIANISQDDYNKAQSALQCKTYGSYTPSATCVPNGKYQQRIGQIDNLLGRTKSDKKLSEESRSELSNLATEVQEEVGSYGEGENDFRLVEYLGVLIQYMTDIQCPEPVNPQPPPAHDPGALWPIPYQDPNLDDDGFDRFGIGPIDCNDFDPSINPAAPEVCNNKDDNCNGLIDDAPDNDGDGVTICSFPPDCDDNNPRVSPLYEEICSNNIDDNCNGEVDEEPCIGCIDEDGDGFSPVGGSCGEVDCDDTNPDINPDAKEISNDGIDSNCNGRDNCFIATAAFGDPLDQRINILRRFRDTVLLKSDIGRYLVAFYYKMSPPIAAYIHQHKPLQVMTRVCLIPVITIISLIIDKKVPLCNIMRSKKPLTLLTTH